MKDKTLSDGKYHLNYHFSIIVIIVFQSILLFGQSNKTYNNVSIYRYEQYGKNPLEISLHFCSINLKYEMAIIYYDDNAFMHYFFLSYGSYKKYNSELFLIDELDSFTTKFIISNNNDIILKEGYTFLIDKTFSSINIKDSVVNDAVYFCLPDPLGFDEFRSNNLNSLKEEHNIILTSGKYQNCKQCLALDLTNDGQYSYHLYGNTFSSGKWKQNNNKLNLIDARTGHAFKLQVVNQTKIINLTLPGNTNSLYLIDKKNINTNVFGFYDLITKNNGFDKMILELCKDSMKYYLMFYYKEPTGGTFVSSGDYLIQNDEIIFIEGIDSLYHRFRFLEDGNLLVLESFSFLNGKIFEHGIGDENSDCYNSDIKEFVYNLNKTNLKSTIKLIDTNSRVKFFTGKYMYKVGDNCLEIKSNGKYDFKAGQYLITEGSWSQKGNILLLTDMSNKHTYKVLISNENNIINLTLPSYGDNKFYRIK